MPSAELERLRARIAPLRSALLDHPIYGRIEGIPALRRFMEHHVFAVWDFMSLLKALQGRLCCVDVPWTPPTNPAACRTINEIVLGEESDVDGRGGFASHFDLYRQAMISCGARTLPIDRFVDLIRLGADLPDALTDSGSPEAVRPFVSETFATIQTGQTHAIASAFTFGREDLLPDVFRRIVEELNVTSDGDLDGFRFYLDRHIELDSDEHGPMAERLLVDLCDGSPSRWLEAEDAAVRSLDARLRLWNAVVERLEGRAIDDPRAIAR